MHRRIHGPWPKVEVERFCYGAMVSALALLMDDELENPHPARILWDH